MLFPPGIDDHPLSTEPVAAPPMTESETIKLASVFCFYWFIANWTINVALEFTSVASATILSSMSGSSGLFARTRGDTYIYPGFFTLLIGRVFGVESFTLPKIFAVFTRSVVNQPYLQRLNSGQLYRRFARIAV
jgi:hypothetical protein